MRKKRLFIEAGSLIDTRISGTGHVAKNIVDYLSNDAEFTKTHDIVLLTPFNKVQNLAQHRFNKKVLVKKIYLPARILNGLTRYNLVPPVDIIFGKGTYLFPNFRNWPLLRSRSLTYIHDVAFKKFPEFIEPRNLSMLNGSVDRFLKRTDRVITVSESSRQELFEYFRYLEAHQLVVVENTVDTSIFFPQPKVVIEKLKKKYDLPEKYFFFLSSIEPRKNLMTLLEAYDLYSQKHDDDTGLLIVGGMGWLNQNLVEKISAMQAAGRRVIKPTAWVPDDDIPGLLTGAVALVHPAYHEGFGMPPLEALAAGTPVIVSDIPAIHEVVGEQGNYLKNLNDATELLRLMENVTKKKVDTKALIKQAKKFSPDYCYGKLKTVIQELEDVR